MKKLVRAAAALLLVAVVGSGTADACECAAQCVKTASPTVIGPEYPATVHYEVVFSCIENGACGRVGTLTDSLLPPDYFTSQMPIRFGTFPDPPDSTIRYDVTFASFEECVARGGSPIADGSIPVNNVVNAIAYPISPEGSPPFSCEQEILCRPPSDGNGCTSTPGYWKTHSSYGPAPYDATWANLPQGADTAFFISGQSYFEVLWTDSAGGDAYYILARAYIAAVLNGYAGASVPTDVQAALDFAETFFATYTPGATLTKQVRAGAIAWAGLLDNYNNGVVGPGHCE